MSTTIYRYTPRVRTGQKKAPSPFQSVSGKPIPGEFHLEVECRLDRPGLVRVQIGEDFREETVGPGGHRIVFRFDAAPPAGDAPIHLTYRASAPQRRLLAGGPVSAPETIEDWILEAVTQPGLTRPVDAASPDVSEGVSPDPPGGGTIESDPLPTSDGEAEQAAKALAELQERLRLEPATPALPLAEDPSALETMIRGWRKRALQVDDEPPVAETHGTPSPADAGPDAPEPFSALPREINHDSVSVRIDALESRVAAMEARLLDAIRGMEKRLAATDPE